MQDVNTRANGAPDTTRPKPRWTRRRVAAGATVVVVIAAAGVAVYVADPFKKAAPSPRPAAVDTTLAPVQEGPLAARVSQTGTLSYAAQDDGTPYAVVNQVAGIYTGLPSTGDQIACGKTLYWVGDTPVPLLCGSHPVYRALSEGESGTDVAELNKNLVKLGYASSDDLDPDSDYFGSATATAVEALQDDLNVDQTGSLKLGAAVFLPGPLRIGKTTAKLGTRAAPSQPIAEATSTDRVVTIDLDASQQSDVKVGAKATVTLPDNRTMSGTVYRIGAVATSSSDSSDSSDSDSSSSSTATLPVYVRLKHPKAAGSLDQAPVQVQITIAGVKKALIVPVTALIGQAGGGYAVEKAGRGGSRQIVPVTLGLFDDAEGLVQVTGNLTAGDRVVVPRT